MHNKSFRSDINGLRALAVLSVVIFHFDNNLLSGGFVGVDIFFVISGYLMTLVIFNARNESNNSIFSFLKKRVKRIVPALTYMIFFVLTLGFLLLSTSSYQSLGKYASSSLLFISNFFYAQETGYFDPASGDNILLHTWSLSVEWQFYIVYPILIFSLFKKSSEQKIKKILVGLTLLSFLLSIYVSSINSSLSYFMFYTRSWEMLAGGLVFLYQVNIKKNTNKKLLLTTGFIFILFSFFFVSDKMAWPNYFTAIPVIGTCFIIIANTNTKLFSNPLIQKIGLISYSIYLFHWPILVIFKKIDTPLNFISYIALTFIISYLSYTLIELRKNYKLTAVIFSLSLFISITASIDGMSFRLSEQIKNVYGGGSHLQESNGVIFKNGSGEDDVILIGDSYSQQFFSFYENEKLNFSAVTQTACITLPDYYNNETKPCKEMYEKVKSKLTTNTKTPVVIAQNWGRYEYKNKLLKKNDDSPINEINYLDILERQLIKIISENGSEREYYLIGEYQRPTYNVIECLSIERLPLGWLFKSCDSTTKRTNSEYDDMLQKLSEKFSNVHFLSPKNYFCHNDNCDIIISNNPVFFDGNHLSSIGSFAVGQFFLENIKLLKNKESNDAKF